MGINFNRLKNNVLTKPKWWLKELESGGRWKRTRNLCRKCRWKNSEAKSVVSAGGRTRKLAVSLTTEVVAGGREVTKFRVSQLQERVAAGS